MNALVFLQETARNSSLRCVVIFSWGGECAASILGRGEDDAGGNY